MHVHISITPLVNNVLVALRFPRRSKYSVIYAYNQFASLAIGIQFLIMIKLQKYQF